MTLARMALAAVTALLVSSCATGWQASEEKAPSRAEVVGSYDIQGDGLGVCMSIDLSAGGTYLATFCGGEHRGEDAVERHGRWQLERNHIFFYDADGKYHASAYLNYAETFYYKNAPAFVLATHLDHGKVLESFVFIKQLRDGAQ